MDTDFIEWSVEHPIEALKLKYETEISMLEMIIDAQNRELERYKERVALAISMI